MVDIGTSTALTRVNEHAPASKLLLEWLARGPLPHWSEFARHILLRTVAPGAPLFLHEADHPFAYVVRRGLIKNVYVREGGEEWIKSFIPEGRFFASISALEPGGRSSFSAVAVEHSELERIPFEILAKYAEIDLVWANTLRRAIMVFAARKEQRERELLTLTAELRYRQFVADDPALERRLTQKDLAAYIGITPVGLNRIVRRVREAVG
jgi:CRP/FNR family transcriptional regulator, anaerobic regulatory protein